jgi:hypothetical protein
MSLSAGITSPIYRNAPIRINNFFMFGFWNVLKMQCKLILIIQEYVLI